MRVATVLGLTLGNWGWGNIKYLRTKWQENATVRTGTAGSAWKAAACLRLLSIITCSSFISAAAASCRCCCGVVSGSVRVLHVASPVGF